MTDCTGNLYGVDNCNSEEIQQCPDCDHWIGCKVHWVDCVEMPEEDYDKPYGET
jgi:hypothetical protein